jgi:hypothetical protein
MFDYLKFRFTLSRIERADRKIDRKHRAVIKKARAQNASKDEIETLEYEPAMDGIDSAAEIRKLHSRYYSRQAARMLIPIGRDDDEACGLMKRRVDHLGISPTISDNDVLWVALICLTGNHAQQLLRVSGPQAWISISRKSKFAERIQVDLGRPVLSVKIIRFSRR